MADEGIGIKRSKDFSKVLKDLVTELEGTEPVSRIAREELITILKTNTTDNRCLLNAKDDEPIFVLIARDRLFRPIVELWSRLAKVLGARLQKWESAQQIAEAGEQYQTKTGNVKNPD